MTLSIELPPNQMITLGERARSFGLSTEEFARILFEVLLEGPTLDSQNTIAAVRERLPRQINPNLDGNGQNTLYDRIKNHLGVLASNEYVEGGARMSEKTGERFAKGMARKRDQGHL